MVSRRTKKAARTQGRYWARTYCLLVVLLLCLSLNIGGGSAGGSAEENVGGAAGGSEDVTEVLDREDTTTSSTFSLGNVRTIAHALGGVEGISYLNCREGFVGAYEAGCRVFEVDLTRTSDDAWVCRHSWTDPMGQWEGEDSRKLDKATFLEKPYYGKYQGLAFADLVELLTEYPDAYLLLDTKHYSITNYQNALRDYSSLLAQVSDMGAEGILDRCIPEIYNESMYYGIAMLHSFPAFMYSCWQSYSLQELEEIAAFCKDHALAAVAIAQDDWSGKAQELFTRQGIYVYVYTVNEAEQAEALLDAGVQGIVTDFLVGVFPEAE